MKWCVYYIDGTTFSNVDGSPEDSPGGGVLAVVQEDDSVGVLVHRNDFYCFDEQYEGWYGLDVFGLTQYLMRPGFKIVKLGEAMSTDKYKEMIQCIRNNPDLPNKSAHYPWEASP